MATVDDTLTLSAASTGSQDVTTSADANTGTVTIAVSDVKNNGLPLTGQSGLMVTVIVGGAIVAVSAVAMAKRNRSAKE
jgi:LPXTG-motif cell wall-anchored protein